MADGLGRSLYATNTHTFDLDTFSAKEFIVKDFVEGLSQNISTQRKSGTGAGSNAFEPKPYIRTFESALQRLKDLNQDLADTESELKEGVRRAEIEHGRKINELGRKLEITLERFQKLDVNIGSTAVKIGEKLELLDKQRRRSIDAKFLIECYVEFSRGDTSRLERMRKNGRIDDSIRCAVISRQLMSIAEKLDLSSGDRTRNLIEKFSESLEKDLLHQFDVAYRQMDIIAMRGCAQVLHDFNGGASVKALFVNQHEFFISKQHMITTEVTLGGETWDKLPDPDADPPPLEKSLAEIIQTASLVVKQESSLVKEFFPVPEDVLKMFLQRIFQQTIQQRLEMVLEKAETVSPLAFLRTLQASRNAIDALIEDMKNHGLLENPQRISSSEILTCLEQNVDDLFTPYMEGSTRYIEREKKSLEDLYESILFKFNTFHVRRKKLANTTIIDRWKTQIQSSTATARDRVIQQLQESEAMNPRRKEQLLRLAGIGSYTERKGKGEDKLADIELEETDGDVSVEVAKRMLKWLAESVGRSLEMSPSSDTPKDAATFLSVLLEHVGIYVETALDACMDFATTAENAKQEPDLSYFQELDPIATVLHLIFKTIHTALIPLSQSSLTVRREMNLTEHRYKLKVEERMNMVIQKTIDIIMAYVVGLLIRQAKRDFRPRDDDVHLTTLQTPTCLAISAFMNKVHNLAINSLSGANLDAFLLEVATGFRTRFLEHLRRNTFNAAGGLMLTKDIVHYQDIFSKWDFGKAISEGTKSKDSIKEGWELLHEIGNLYMVPAGALKDKIRDGFLAKAKRELLIPYLQKREDYLTAGIEKLVTD